MLTSPPAVSRGKAEPRASKAGTATSRPSAARQVSALCCRRGGRHRRQCGGSCEHAGALTIEPVVASQGLQPGVGPCSSTASRSGIRWTLPRPLEGRRTPAATAHRSLHCWRRSEQGRPAHRCAGSSQRGPGAALPRSPRPPALHKGGAKYVLHDTHCSRQERRRVAKQAPWRVPCPHAVMFCQQHPMALAW